MKTAVHIVLILLAGVGLGLLTRSLRQSASPQGPSADDVVYTTEIAPGESVPDDIEISNEEPSRPPAGEEWLTRFELTERSGETLTTEQLLGQPYVVSFFFSTCPSICVQQNQKIQELQKEFEGQAVRFVAISVDPETDTPEVLREYAARFGADPDQWLFLTGELGYIRQVSSMVFRLPVDLKFHSERFVLIDAKGEIKGFYTWPEDKQYAKLRDDIRELIRDPATKKS